MLAGQNGPDFVLVQVHSDDTMSHFRQTSRGYAPHVTEPQDRDSGFRRAVDFITCLVWHSDDGGQSRDETGYNGDQRVVPKRCVRRCVNLRVFLSAAGSPAMKKILVIFGTRPEAIKLSPVILYLRRCPDFDVRTCATAQHRELLDQVLTCVPDQAGP